MVWHVPLPMRAIGGGKFVPETRAAGLPDLIMLHTDPPRLIFAELKGTTGDLSDEQRAFLKAARMVALEAHDPNGKCVVGSYVWRPGVEDLIETILRGKVMA